MSYLILILVGVTLGQISPFGLAHISTNWFPPRIAGSNRGFTVNILAYRLNQSPSLCLVHFSDLPVVVRFILPRLLCVS
jgi:hypothetical protein